MRKSSEDILALEKGVAHLTGNTYLPGTFFKGFNPETCRNKLIKRRIFGRGQDLRKGKLEVAKLQMKRGTGRMKSSSSTTSLKKSGV